VEYFAEAVLPQLRRQVPGIRFVVAGRNPSAEFLARFSDQSDISFTGTVPDMRPLIDKASLVVVPLRVGSGTRLKILEAAAMGKAMVSTSLGAEGLEFENGRNIELRDTPEAFADAVAQLLLDPARRRDLGRAARKTVEAKYSLPVLRASLRAALQELQTAAEAGAVAS
jgi:glycosyltransferase involved in cell wall biosynthesis